MKSAIFILLIISAAFSASGQKSKDVIHSDAPITWLGLDFTQARFIGSATQFKDAGEVTAGAMRDKYIPAWNGLFIDEQKKYDVAKYVKRETVNYNLDATKNANYKVGASFFSENPGDYEHLTESDIKRLVKGYNFSGGKGIGLIFFVEGMSKGKEEACAWVTFVDMDTKTVVQTRRITGKAGGFGMRNYWAKAFLNILKDI